VEIIEELGSKINQKFIFQGSRLNGEKSFKIFSKSNRISWAKSRTGLLLPRRPTGGNYAKIKFKN